MRKLGKKLRRYLKRVVCVVIAGGLGYLAAHFICFLLDLLNPGWLIVVLMYVLKVAVPLCAAFLALAEQLYKEAVEDNKLDELLSGTPPICSKVINGAVSLGESAPKAVPADDAHFDITNEPEHMVVPENEPKADTIIYASSDIYEEPAPKPNPVEDKIENNPEPSPNSVDPDDLSNNASKAKLETEHNTVTQESPDTMEALTSGCEDTAPVESTDVQQEVACEDTAPPDPLAWIRDPNVLVHYVVLDIETTGFSPTNDRIIEIAAIHYVFDSEVSRFCTYVNPEISIPNHITKLTGIHQADVDSAPLIDDIVDDFVAFIKDYPLVGHNITDFDLPFLVAQFGISIPNIIIDTLPMSRLTFPDLPTHRLSDLKDWFRLHDGESHHAEDDVIATNALLWACLYPADYASHYRKAVRNGGQKSIKPTNPRSEHYGERIHTSDITPNVNNIDHTGPLYGKKIVFTGELSIPRKQAMQLAVNAGAVLRSSVSGKTDYLVVGKQDKELVGEDGMSTKEEKAQSLNLSGKASIQFINDAEFLSLVSREGTPV